MLSIRTKHVWIHYQSLNECGFIKFSLFQPAEAHLLLHIDVIGMKLLIQLKWILGFGQIGITASFLKEFQARTKQKCPHCAGSIVSVDLWKTEGCSTQISILCCSCGIKMSSLLAFISTFFKEEAKCFIDPHSNWLLPKFTIGQSPLACGLVSSTALPLVLGQELDCISTDS